MLAVGAEVAGQARRLPGGRRLRAAIRCSAASQGFADARAAPACSSRSVFGRPFNGGIWLTVTFLSFVCAILLPRQFHVTVVENNSEHEIRRAAWMFPLYLVLINLFVVPIAAAGLLMLPPALVDPDMYVLALPMAHGADMVTLLAFIGGLSAATAMVIVESVALSIMICNGLVVPALLRRGAARGRPARGHGRAGCSSSAASRSSASCWPAISCIARSAQSQGLAAIGLVSFAAIAQLAPAFFVGLVWRKGTARGAIAGIVAGFAVWAYTLLLPWVVKAGCLPSVAADARAVRHRLAEAAGAALPEVRAADARRAVEPRGQRRELLRGFAAALAGAGRAAAGARCSSATSRCGRPCRSRPARSGSGARRSRSATCRRPRPAISAPSAPNARSLPMPPRCKPAADKPCASTPKPTSRSCASPSTC